jgi:hypothetical protein
MASERTASWLKPTQRGASIDGLSLDRSRTVADVEMPFEPIPPFGSRLRTRLEREALRLNDRYLLEFIERYAFCPFAKEGREAGTTTRHVYFADEPSVDGLLDLMERTAAATEHVVTQVILPLVEVAPVAWRRFCFRLTAAGHARMGGRDVLAVAPLHPELSYRTVNPYALVPLFRRSPDPTIQWVRLDGLEALYQGRESGKHYVDPQDLPALLEGPTPPRPLYDRVAETNQSMARRLSYEKVEALLADFATDARRSYARIILDSPAEASGGEDAP